MADIVAYRHAVAWRAQLGETPEEHLTFLWWAFGGGDINEKMSDKYEWNSRRQTIETYECIEAIDPGEQGVEAAMARVRITLTEILKLQQSSMSSPNSVLSSQEVMAGVEWMCEAQEGMLERKSAMLDWTQLNDDERDIMLKAKDIQERLMLNASR